MAEEDTVGGGRTRDSPGRKNKATVRFRKIVKAQKP